MSKRKRKLKLNLKNTRNKRSIVAKNDTNNNSTSNIVLAAITGDLNSMHQYITDGIDLNTQQKWKQIKSNKEHYYFDNTALIEASQNGHIDIVKALLLAGANPNIKAYPKSIQKEHNAIEAAINSTKKNNENSNTFNAIIQMLKNVSDLWIKMNNKPTLQNIKNAIETENENISNRKRKLSDENDACEHDNKKRKIESEKENKNEFVREYFECRTGIASRDKMVSKFIDILQPNIDREEYINYKQIASDIEQCLACDFSVGSNNYVNRYRDLHYNIKKNDDLKMKLLFGMIEPSELMDMTNAEMSTKLQKDQRIEYRKKTINDARSDHGMDSGHAITDEFKCEKCNERKCKYTQAQIGAVYQAMTTFVTCLGCGNKWKC
eukprot:538988_1